MTRAHDCESRRDDHPSPWVVDRSDCAKVGFAPWRRSRHPHEPVSCSFFNNASKPINTADIDIGHLPRWIGVFGERLGVECRQILEPTHLPMRGDFAEPLDAGVLAGRISPQSPRRRSAPRLRSSKASLTDRPRLPGAQAVRAPRSAWRDRHAAPSRHDRGQPRRTRG